MPILASTTGYKKTPITVLRSIGVFSKDEGQKLGGTALYTLGYAALQRKSRLTLRKEIQFYCATAFSQFMMKISAIYAKFCANKKEKGYA